MTGVSAFADLRGFSVASEPLSEASRTGLAAEGALLILLAERDETLDSGLVLGSGGKTNFAFSLASPPASTTTRSSSVVSLSSSLGARLPLERRKRCSREAWAGALGGSLWAGTSKAVLAVAAVWVLTGLVAKASSSLVDSMLGAMDGLDRVVARDVLEPLREGLAERVELDRLESLDGGS